MKPEIFPNRSISAELGLSTIAPKKITLNGALDSSIVSRKRDEKVKYAVALF
jgi:hypothetical protein